jgi:hypothetical protein
VQQARYIVRRRLVATVRAYHVAQTDAAERIDAPERATVPHRLTIGCNGWERDGPGGPVGVAKHVLEQQRLHELADHALRGTAIVIALDQGLIVVDLHGGYACG